jgi:NAD(P)-dependent dehydrogenase (short-subunit alcohol dehydrogenase family)
MAVVTDITSPESVEELASAVAAQYESVDVLVNNAGVCCTGSFAETTLDDW